MPKTTYRSTVGAPSYRDMPVIVLSKWMVTFKVFTLAASATLNIDFN